MNASQLKKTTMEPEEAPAAACRDRQKRQCADGLEARFRFIQDRAAFAKDLDI
jgi:hypothetical protein